MRVNASISTKPAARMQGAALAGLLLLGAWLRFHDIGSLPLWTDEAYSVAYARLPLSTMWGPEAAFEVNPPLYYSLLKAWTIFGESEAAVRALSAGFGVATIAIVFFWGRLVGGPWSGAIAALLIATAPLHIRYAQEARTYALVILAGALALVGASYLLRQPDRAARPLRSLLHITERDNRAVLGAWACYALGVLVGLYSHATMVMLPAAIGLAALYIWIFHAGANRQIAVNWVLANGLVLFLFAPGLIIVLGSLSQMGEFWIPPVTATEALETTLDAYRPRFIYAARPWIDIFWVALAAFGLLALRKHPADLALCLSVIVVVPLGLYLISLGRPVFLPRVLVWPTLAIALAIAVGTCALRRPILVALALAALLVIQLRGAANYYTSFEKEPWDQVARYVRSGLRDGDAILLIPTFTVGPPFHYYFGTAPNPIVTMSAQPQAQPDRPDLIRYRTLARSEVAAFLAQHDRLWIVYRPSPGTTMDQLSAILSIATAQRAVTERAFGPLRVIAPP